MQPRGVTISPVSVADLRKRVLPLEGAQESATAALKRMGASGDGAVVVRPFAVAYPFGAFAATEMGKCLSNFAAALEKQFSMELPQGTVTVYGVPEVVEASLGKSVDQIDADFVTWFGPPAAPRTGGQAPAPNSSTPPANMAPPAQGPRQEGPQQTSGK